MVTSVPHHAPALRLTFLLLDEPAGPGTVYLQSLSYEKLIKSLVKQAGGAQKKDEPSINLGGPVSADEMER